MKTTIALALLGLALPAQAGPEDRDRRAPTKGLPSGTAQLITADVHSATGGVLTSANYRLAATAGHALGTLSTSANITSKGHFAGQLYTPVALAVSAAPDPVPESGTTQAAARAIMNDATTLPLAGNAPQWSIVSGPLLSIDSNGLATAATVFEDSLGVLSSSFAGLTGNAPVTILDSDPDNFGSYAGDGITDGWQFANFGPPPNPDAAPGANPDHDPHDNRVEWLTGYDPNDASSFFTFQILSLAGTTATLQLSKVIPGTLYTLERSIDLGQAVSWTEVNNLTTGSEQSDVPLTDKTAPSPRAFYRIGVEPE